jgi:hypothetical protein
LLYKTDNLQKQGDSWQKQADSWKNRLAKTGRMPVPLIAYKVDVRDTRENA